jgi:hypothetical protein
VIATSVNIYWLFQQFSKNKKKWIWKSNLELQSESIHHEYLLSLLWVFGRYLNTWYVSLILVHGRGCHIFSFLDLSLPLCRFLCIPSFA